MGFIVKITTKCEFLDLLCPYRCRGCNKLGKVFCDCCKKNLVLKRKNFCPICHKENNRKCDDCDLVFDRIWTVGFRDEIIGSLIKEYKYQSVRKIGDVLTDIMDTILPDLNDNVVIVPLPTIARHIRERGLDHTALVAKKIAKKRRLKMQKIIKRSKNTVQVGADMKKRQDQARKAYMVEDKISPEMTYLLIDDVWTTGSSMISAAEILRQNGATKIYGAVFAVNRENSEIIDS